MTPFFHTQPNLEAPHTARYNAPTRDHYAAALRAGAIVAPLLCCVFASTAFAGSRLETREDRISLNSSLGVCYPLVDLKSSINSQGGALVELTPEQFQFARGMYVVSGSGSMELPPGDHALVGKMPDGAAGVVFVDGDSACGVALLGGSSLQLLLAVGSGAVPHVGNGT